MAGERKGKTYEALVKVALDRLKAEQGNLGEIFWNETPAGMTIEPDFCIGADVNHPQIVILVTHSGSAKESEKKLWRNMGELSEAKVLVPNLPHVVSVVFDSVIKESLKSIQNAAFDGQLIVGDRPYGTRLQQWVDAHHSRLPTGQNEKANQITSMVGSDTELENVLTNLTCDIATLLTQSQPDLDQMWAMERGRIPGRAPSERITYVRRGLSKLLIFEDLGVALRLFRGQRVRVNEVPQYAFDLGLARRSLRGAVSGDPEIENAVNLLTDDSIRAIIQAAPMETINAWLSLLRNIPHIRFMGDYVNREYNALCDPDILCERLNGLHDDPWALVDRGAVPANWPPTNVWLFEYLMEVIKTSTGDSNGYGYAQLAREIAVLNNDALNLTLMNNGLIIREDTTNEQINVEQQIRFQLPSWILRNETNIESDLINLISQVLASKLQVITQQNIIRTASDIVENITSNLIEAKLCTYRGFEPLLYLIKQVCPQAREVSIRTCFAEKAAVGGQAGKTRVVQVQNTLINWQSVSDAGRDHKKKELCGRAVGLRYSWNAALNQFVRRSGVNKLILVLDGTWRQRDLDALARAGWDEIFYADELVGLAGFII